MKIRISFFGFLLTFVLACISLSAQPQEQYVKVNVSLDHADWLYKPGEKVKFAVSITKNKQLLQNVEIRYSYGADMMPPVKHGKLTLKNGETIIDGGTLKDAGFLRCRVDVQYQGKDYNGSATAGFAPESIQPVTTQPTDFVQFWDKAKAELAKIPVSPKLTLIPERSTDKVNAYYVSMQNIDNSILYGVLCIPKGAGKYPAVLKVPGAGVNSYAGDVANTERGAITLEIGIHGIPVNLDHTLYSSLRSGALAGYWQSNLDDKDRYYYKRVYLGCIRAVDFIFNLPEFDGSNIVVSGESQGGALSIVTAALDSRIKGVSVFYPALCDLTGYLHGRAGGWPHLFNANSQLLNDTQKKLETVGYYDVVNFARLVKVPGFYSWGYNDTTCPPTSMFAAYNVIKAPKTLLIAEETGHWKYPEQNEASWIWIMQFLSK